MKHLLKAAVIMAGVMLVNIMVNIVCNKNGIDLNSTIQAFMSALLAIWAYHIWIKSEGNKDDGDEK